MQSAYSLSQELGRGQGTGTGKWIARAQDKWTATINSHHQESSQCCQVAQFL